MTDGDVIVIGGGISGLSFAHCCAEAGLAVTVLEKTERLGGCIHSERLSSGYWFEMGAHTCYNSYGGLIGIIENCGLRGRLTTRARVPFRLLKDERLHSILGEINLWEAVRSAPRILATDKQGQTVRSYYSKLVGPENYRRVLSPMLAAVPSQDADAFPATMLFKKRPRRKDVTKSFTLTGGLQTLIDCLANRPRITTETGIEISAIERERSTFGVTTVDGRRLAAARLAVAIPPPRAAELLADAFPEVAARLAQIQTVAVHTVGVVVAKEKLALPPVAGIVPIRDLFYSAVTRDTVPDDRYRAFAFHFRPDTPAEARLARITSLLHVDERDFEAIVERWVELPSPVLGHQQLVDDIDRLTADVPLFITGNYFAGLAIEDCVSRSLQEFARLQQLQ